MREERGDPVAELAKGMEAAGALIESLEEEAASLRRDLEEASVALKAAQEEVSARGRALDELSARGAAQGEVESLRAEISALETRHADEQLRLGNEHITELSEVRRRLEEQHRAELEAVSSEGRLEGLKEEFRREREALEERHGEEIQALKSSSREWEERLRQSYREQEMRHAVELEDARRELEERGSGLEGSAEEALNRRLSEERSAAEERHEAALRALRDAAAGREMELQRDYQAVVETQQAEIESLRAELEEGAAGARDRHRDELRGVKALAEGRERELRRAHAQRLAEANEAADRRVAAIQAQREADNRALRARSEEEVARLRREVARLRGEYEERLAAQDERRKLETWSLEERLNAAKIEREAEQRAYAARLKELEAARLAQRSAAEEHLARAEERFEAEASGMQDRVTELEEDLEESEAHGEVLETELDELRAQKESERGPRAGEPPREGESADGADGADGADARLEEIDARRVLAEERTQDLEALLREAREENGRNARELADARERLRKLSDPERRLREGIALFNASEHARTVASISKAFGLPRVHAGLDGAGTAGENPGKPVLTFAWGEMAWRRYVSDPTEGVEEPRVYLVGTGDDPAQINDAERPPNARMDARGRLMLGVQAL